MDEYEKYDNGSLLRKRYLKVADISKGSYGLVSLAKDTKLDNKLVAVKFIYPLDYKSENKINDRDSTRATSSPARLRSTADHNSQRKNSILKALYEEAAKEISIHKILGVHPNISSLCDHFDSCLILEYCSRGDLYEAIQNGDGPTTSQDIKDVFHQVLNALEYCHSNNVFHRDLKPENILIADDWSIKLCDWGLATTSRNITNKNEFDIGSERYMAPELFDQNIEYYDASKIDLWSIGIILLTLVFHKNPFQVANYSDKRFIQFSSNREALFDIFSTMSGEMFSVTRYCLNIDPSNRDLQNFRTELTALKYFTIDEEYWASDYEDEDLEEADIDEDEEEVYFNDEANEEYLSDSKKESTVSVSVSPEKSIPSISTTDVESKSITNLKSETDSTKDSDNVNSDTNALKNTTVERMIPHNHRADALLSSTTNLKPIPISEGNIKFFRNTRKPFNVASYNQSAMNNSSHYNKYQNGYNSNSRFNREDFFTPKSVFNHYMDKYGEQRSNNCGKYQRPQHGNNKYYGLSDWKKNDRNHRSWKKNYKNTNSNMLKNNNKGRSYYSTAHNNENDSINNCQISNSFRRKSHLFSTTKARKSYLNNDAPASAFQSLSHINNTNTNNTLSLASGKYIPPYLRSPHYMKSPEVGPVTQEIENLDLDNDDDEEVFHLDYDFEVGNSKGNISPTNSGKSPAFTQSSPSNGDINFKKPNFKVPTYSIPNIGPDTSGGSGVLRNYSYANNYKGSGNNTRRNSTFTSANPRPISMGNNPLSDITASLPSSSCSASGKYVPPFRRGSHCPTTNASVNDSNNPNGKIKSHNITNNIDKRKSNALDDKNNLPLSVLSQVNENRIASSSVPSDKTDWFAWKKE